MFKSKGTCYHTGYKPTFKIEAVVNDPKLEKYDKPRLIVVIDWGEECTADTYGHHFLAGTKAAGSNPATCLVNLAKAWRENDIHQAMISAIDMGDDE